MARRKPNADGKVLYVRWLEVIALLVAMLLNVLLLYNIIVPPGPKTSLTPSYKTDTHPA